MKLNAQRLKSVGFAPGTSEKHLNDEQGNPANALLVRYWQLRGGGASLRRPWQSSSERA